MTCCPYLILSSHSVCPVHTKCQIYFTIKLEKNTNASTANQYFQRTQVCRVCTPIGRTVLPLLMANVLLTNEIICFSVPDLE